MSDLTSDLSGTTTLVVGASRGLGRGIAAALAEAGAPVVAVARTAPDLADVASTEAADATDAATPPAACSTGYDPSAVVLVAGATPVMRPLQDQTWETFSVNWHDRRQDRVHLAGRDPARPLRPGSRVVVVSSGAALAGSPLSGGYAGAKATQRFLTGYAQDEANRAGLGITVTAVLPRLTPLTDLGRPAVQAYAARSGLSEEDYLRQLGEPLTPEAAGAAVVDLVRADTASIAPAYLLSGEGLKALT